MIGISPMIHRTALLAWIVLGERLHWFQWVGVACAAVAVGLITAG
jgi:drug/metabolite transporter (DMT)-like permease